MAVVVGPFQIIFGRGSADFFPSTGDVFRPFVPSPLLSSFMSNSRPLLPDSPSNFVLSHFCGRNMSNFF